MTLVQPDDRGATSQHTDRSFGVFKKRQFFDLFERELERPIALLLIVIGEKLLCDRASLAGGVAP